MKEAPSLHRSPSRRLGLADACVLLTACLASAAMPAAAQTLSLVQRIELPKVASITWIPGVQ